MGEYELSADLIVFPPLESNHRILIFLQTLIKIYNETYDAMNDAYNFSISKFMSSDVNTFIFNSGNINSLSNHVKIRSIIYQEVYQIYIDIYKSQLVYGDLKLLPSSIILLNNILGDYNRLDALKHYPMDIHNLWILRSSEILILGKKKEWVKNSSQPIDTLEWLIKYILSPNGYNVNGSVRSEYESDPETIIVKNNEITRIPDNAIEDESEDEST